MHEWGVMGEGEGWKRREGKEGEGGGELVGRKRRGWGGENGWKEEGKIGGPEWGKGDDLGRGGSWGEGGGMLGLSGQHLTTIHLISQHHTASYSIMSPPNIFFITASHRTIYHSIITFQHLPHSISQHHHSSQLYKQSYLSNTAFYSITFH